VIVCRIGGGLKGEHVFAANVFLDLDEDFLIGEAADQGFSERDVEVSGNGLRQHPVRIARKELHDCPRPRPLLSGLLAASPAIASMLSEKVNSRGAGQVRAPASHAAS